MEESANQILKKIETARKLILTLPSIKFNSDEISYLTNEITKIETKFALKTSKLFLKEDRNLANLEFTRLLATEDFVYTTDKLVKHIKSAFQEYAFNSRSLSKKEKSLSGDSDEIQKILNMYPFGQTGENTYDSLKYDECPSCHINMMIDANRSELHCQSCGHIRELVGTVFDDFQFYNQEGQKAKSGTFKPNRHFQLWWSHILAREPEEELGDKKDLDNQYGEKLITDLRKLIENNTGIILRRLTVDNIRDMLMKIGKTQFNKNVPLILKKLTGIAPPHLPDTLAVRVENLFTKAIEISEEVRRKDRVNRNYYPYYIYKILEQILPEDDYESRRILFYIYIQSDTTVRSDDRDWEEICKKLVEISYVPTNRYKGELYQFRL